MERLAVADRANTGSTLSSTGIQGRRLWEVDAARGIAICMMVLYHLVFDLDYFGGYGIRGQSGFWYHFADATAALFIFLVGVSMTLSFWRAVAVRGSPEGLWWKYIKRGLGIFSLGLLITLVTWVVVGDQAIVFGILHLIGAAIVLAYPLIRFKWASLVLGIAVIVAGLYAGTVRVDYPWLVWLGFQPQGFPGLDYRPLLPWFGFALLGLFAGNALYENGKRQFYLPDLSRLPVVRVLSFLGRHSLVIYLVHQPVLIAVLSLLGIIDFT